MTTEQTCEQTIDGYYNGRMETISALIKAEGIAETDELTDAEFTAADLGNADAMDDFREAASERLDEMPLSVEVFRTAKILLGTGGPGDWFECRLDSDGEIARIDYHYNDWGDHAERTVPESDEAAWEFCRRFVEIATGNY